jgi:hypothetical protein
MIVVLAETKPHTDEWLEEMRARVIERASEGRARRLRAAHHSGSGAGDDAPPRFQPGEGGPDLAIHRPSRRVAKLDHSDSATIVPPYASGWANPDGSGDPSDVIHQHGGGFFDGAVVDYRRALRNSGRMEIVSLLAGNDGLAPMTEIPGPEGRGASVRYRQPGVQLVARSYAVSEVPGSTTVQVGVRFNVSGASKLTQFREHEPGEFTLATMEVGLSLRSQRAIRSASKQVYHHQAETPHPVIPCAVELDAAEYTVTAEIPARAGEVIRIAAYASVFSAATEGSGFYAADLFGPLRGGDRPAAGIDVPVVTVRYLP